MVYLKCCLIAMVTNVFICILRHSSVCPYFPHHFMLPNIWFVLFCISRNHYYFFFWALHDFIFDIFQIWLIQRFLFSSRKVLKAISVGDLKPNETVEANLEAQLLSKLDHPAIVRFYASFVERDGFCIITEYCEVRLVAYFGAMWQDVCFKTVS